MKEIVKLNINNKTFEKAVDAGDTLLDFIRNEVGLTGTKRGCDKGECGCCTVLINEKPKLACLMLAVDAQGEEIATVEGIAKGTELHPIQRSFVEEGAIQCGFCTPSMVINGVHLYNTNDAPTNDEIKEAISGTICRCTGYTKIEKAIHKACHGKCQ